MKEYNNFEFVLPTHIKYGRGVLGNIGQDITALGKKKPMILTDPGLVAAGLCAKLQEALEKDNVSYVTFDQIEPNPRDTTVQKAFELYKNEGADMLIALGGGSSMDTAKAVGILASHGGVINEYEDFEKITKPICPLIAIPTTTGTGSEVTFWSVITDTERHYKMGIGSPLAAATIALVDPDMVGGLPPKIIATTGMDALTHAIEGYTCTLSEPITDACGIHAIRLIGENIRAAALENDAGAKANMLLGSLLAGISFGNSDVAGVHCMGEALGGLFDTAHGVAMAILLPYVMEFNRPVVKEKFRDIAEALGVDTRGMDDEEASEEAVRIVRQMNVDLKIPTLKDEGVTDEDLPELARRSAMNVCVPSNPRPVTEKDFLDIFKVALRG